MGDRWMAALFVAAIGTVLAVGPDLARGQDGAVPTAEGARPDSAPPGRVVAYAHDTLSVRLSNVPVEEVLDDVARQTGAEIRGSVAHPRSVSAEFDALPLPEALHRLLGDENFTLVYGEGDRLRAIKLLGGPQVQGASTARAPGAPVPAAPAKPAASLPILLGLVNAHPPVQVSGRLAQVLGSSTATLSQVLQMGIQHEDAVVRGEAVRAGLQVLETDAHLRTSFMSTLNGIDDADLARYVRGMAGPRAEETILQIMTQSRGSDFRIKASGILQQLRTGG